MKVSFSAAPFRSRVEGGVAEIRAWPSLEHAGGVE